MSSRMKVKEMSGEELTTARENLARQIGAVLARYWLSAQIASDEKPRIVADVKLPTSAVDQTEAGES